MNNPAKLYAGLVGATLVVAGLIGFAYSTSFGQPGDVDAVLGILDVNAWHNLVHIATGVLGLVAFGYAARQYALGLGAVYVAVAIWGVVIGSGESILGIIPVNTEDNFLHLLLGLTGIAAGLATPVARRPQAQAATAGS